MLKPIKRYAALLVLCLIIALAGTVSAGQLSKVETNRVCMINNEVMAKPQIPVKVDNKMYYGCCEMCAGTLKNDRKARFAIDPVSGKEVDKAKAVIGAKPNGQVLYFESEATFQKFMNSK